MEESHWRALHGGVPVCWGQTNRNQEKKSREGEAICLQLTAIIKTAFTDTWLTEDEISSFGCMGVGLGLVLLFHSSTTASSTLPPSLFLKNIITSQQLSRSDLSSSNKQQNNNKKRVRVQTSNNKKRREECNLLSKWNRHDCLKVFNSDWNRLWNCPGTRPYEKL